LHDLNKRGIVTKAKHNHKLENIMNPTILIIRIRNCIGLQRYS